MQDNDHITDLFWKYLDGNATESETVEVKKLLSENPQYAKELLRMASEQTLLRAVLKEKHQSASTTGRLSSTSPRRSQIKKKWLVLAASLLFFLGILALISHNKPIPSSQNTNLQTQNNVITNSLVPRRDPEPQAPLLTHAPEIESLQTNAIPAPQINAPPPLGEHEQSPPAVAVQPVTPTQSTEDNSPDQPKKEQPIIARFSEISGSVYTLRNKTDAESASPGTFLHLGDGVRVNDGGVATIKFKDGTIIKLLENSLITQISDETINDLEKDEQFTYRTVYLDHGELRANVSKKSDHSQAQRETAESQWHPVTILTAQAKIEVLGTSFRIKSFAQKTIVDVAEGKVKVTNTKSNESEKLTSGESLEVTDQDGSHTKKFQLLPPAGLYAWFKADRGLSLRRDSNEIDSWKDQSENQLIALRKGLKSTSSSSLLLNKNTLHGFPTIAFDGSASLSIRDKGSTIFDDVTIFTVVMPRRSDGKFSGHVYSSYQSELDDRGVRLDLTGLRKDEEARLIIDESKTTKDLSRFHIGIREVGMKNPFQGEIAELIVYTKPLSTEEKESVKWYLSNKYDVQAIDGPLK